MLWSLFVTFLQIGFISFGGGYAMIPVIEREVLGHGWMSPDEFANAIAVAGMAPGPIATNSATYIGFQTAGWSGAVVSTAAMILPSLLMIVLIASFFYRIHESRAVKSSFYGLKPVVAGLIVYAAIHFGFPAGFHDALTWHTAAMLLIAAATLLAILRFRLHPAAVIAASAVIGVLLF